MNCEFCCKTQDMQQQLPPHLVVVDATENAAMRHVSATVAATVDGAARILASIHHHSKQ